MCLPQAVTLLEAHIEAGWLVGPVALWREDPMQKQSVPEGMNPVASGTEQFSTAQAEKAENL